MSTYWLVDLQKAYQLTRQLTYNAHIDRFFIRLSNYNLNYFCIQLHVDLFSYILYHHVNMHKYFHPNIGMLSTYLLDALVNLIKLKPFFHLLPRIKVVVLQVPKITHFAQSWIMEFLGFQNRHPKLSSLKKQPPPQVYILYKICYLRGSEL